MSPAFVSEPIKLIKSTYYDVVVADPINYLRFAIYVYVIPPRTVDCVAVVVWSTVI